MKKFGVKKKNLKENWFTKSVGCLSVRTVLRCSGCRRPGARTIDSRRLCGICSLLLLPGVSNNVATNTAAATATNDDYDYDDYDGKPRF